MRIATPPGAEAPHARHADFDLSVLEKAGGTPAVPGGPRSLRAPARDALDLGADQALGQVVVEPRLEHRLEHFAHQVFQGAGVLHQQGGGQGIERGEGGAGAALPAWPARNRSLQ
jgi:hypothetical protein